MKGLNWVKQGASKVKAVGMTEPRAVARGVTNGERRLDTGLTDRVPAAQALEPVPRLLERFTQWLRAERTEPGPSYFGPVEDPPAADQPHQTGICCSGGGIRSAAFNLGALQHLQATKELQNASYMSAVSGGSYIAAAFATVAQTWPVPKEIKKLPEPERLEKLRAMQPPAKGSDGHDDSDPRLVSATSPPFYRGSPEEQYLRNRASYMAPTGGAKLFLGLRMLLGLAWNLAFLGSIVFAAAVLAGYLYRRHYITLHVEQDDLLSLHPPPAAIVVVAVLAGACLAIGLYLIVVGTTNDAWRRALEAWQVRLLVATVVAGFFLLLAPLLVVALRNSRGSDIPGLSDKGVIASWTGLATVIAGVLAQLRNRIDTRKEAEAELKAGRDLLRRTSKGVRTTIAYAGAALAVPLLFCLGFLLPASWATAAGPSDGLWIAAGACLAGFAAAAVWGDVTTWSLHPFYKRRLATAFALKRVPRRKGDQLGKAVERDYSHLPLIVEADVAADGSPWPMLIVCAAANVSDSAATPPGRSVTSFTFSPGAIGGPLVGAVRPDQYLDKLKKDDAKPSEYSKRTRREMSLLTAVAVSGAALSPSMGKETRWSLRALMALANVRLGIWMRSPRHVAGMRWPRPRPHRLILELFGRSHVNGKFLYVTDGGHYENLGLVELLRRGCTRIFCFDASGGKSFAALGDAIALARSEIGVEISISTDRLRPAEDTGLAESDFVIGDILYPKRKDGTRPTGKLVYVRTVLTEHAPFDVKAFHEEDELFPNHPTTDQLYTDQKFEAYRALGEASAKRALTGLKRRAADAKRKQRAADAKRAARANGDVKRTAGNRKQAAPSNPAYRSKRD